MRTMLIVACVFAAALRIGGMTNQSFQAAAHLLVGFLFGLWFAGDANGKLALRLAISVSLVELGVFLWTKVF